MKRKEFVASRSTEKNMKSHRVETGARGEVLFSWSALAHGERDIA
jgi:hypothetical protein